MRETPQSALVRDRALFTAPAGTTLGNPKFSMSIRLVATAHQFVEAICLCVTPARQAHESTCIAGVKSLATSTATLSLACAQFGLFLLTRSGTRHFRKECDAFEKPYNLASVEEYCGINRALKPTFAGGILATDKLDDTPPQHFCLTCQPSLACLECLPPDEQCKSAQEPTYSCTINVPTECARCSIGIVAVSYKRCVWRFSHHEGAFLSQLLEYKKAAEKRNVQLSWLSFLEGSGTSQMTERKRMLAMFGANIVGSMRATMVEIRWYWAPLVRCIGPLGLVVFCNSTRWLVQFWSTPVTTLRAHAPMRFRTWASELVALGPKDGDTATPVDEGVAEDDAEAAILDVPVPSAPPQAEVLTPGLQPSAPPATFQSGGSSSSSRPPPPDRPPGLEGLELPAAPPACPAMPPGLPDVVTRLSTYSALCTERDGVPARAATNAGLGARMREFKAPTMVPLGESEILSMQPIEGPHYQHMLYTDAAPAVVAGPQLGAACVYDTKSSLNRTAAVEGRMLPPADIKYAPTQGMRKRRGRLLHYLITEVFTPQRIIDVASAMPEFRECASKKLAADKVDALLEVVLGPDYKLPRRSAILKREATAKPLKAPRIVQDEGPERLVANAMVIRVYEAILFNVKVGKKMSIKGRPRQDVLETIAKAFMGDVKHPRTGATEPTAAMEVDQTCFEYHQRLEDGDGLLDWELKLYDHIYKHIGDCLSPTGATYKQVLQEMRAERIDLGAKPPDPRKPDPNRWKIVVDYFFRCSGANNTSSGNWLVEFGNTACILLADPSAPFKRAAAGKPTAGFYKSVFKDKAGEALMLWFDCFVEGDDFVARVSRWLLEYAAKIEASYASLGLEAKLKFAVGTSTAPGRAEFIGQHFCLVDGKLRSPHHQTPDVARALRVSGASASLADDATSIRCALLSKAIGFASSLPAVGNYLYGIALGHAHGKMNELDAMRVYGEQQLDSHTLEKMYLDRVSTCVLSAAEQAMVAACSVECDLDAEFLDSWALFEGAAASFGRNADGDNVVESLPRALREKCLSSLG